MRPFARPLGAIASIAVIATWFGAAPARRARSWHSATPASRPAPIVVRTSERRLYYVIGDGRAIRYPVGVGRAGKQWTGTTRIDGKYVQPAWSPPKEVKRDKPSLPDVIPGG